MQQGEGGGAFFGRIGGGAADPGQSVLGVAGGMMQVADPGAALIERSGLRPWSRSAARKAAMPAGAGGEKQCQSLQERTIQR